MLLWKSRGQEADLPKAIKDRYIRSTPTKLVFRGSDFDTKMSFIAISEMDVVF